jgi:uncharacterized protein
MEDQLVLTFGDLVIGLDPWQVDYDGEVLTEPPPSKPDEGVRLDVETAGAWQPIVPDPGGPVPGAVVFVDGVRRMEARLVVQRPGGIAHGVFASWAAGSVELSGGAARFGDARVDRVLLLGSGLLAPMEVRMGRSLVFRPETTAELRPEAPVEEVQANMQRAESALVRELAAGAELIVADGPLREDGPAPKRVLGYVKRFVRLYLPASHLAILASLPAGGRTPLFLFHRGGFGRLAWYLRLESPARGETAFAGLVRLELAEAAGVDVAAGLADATCRLLPRLAPKRWRDPRAPQNLIPIAALEHHLTRFLGDHLLVRRKIETHMARQAA